MKRLILTFLLVFAGGLNIPALAQSPANTQVDLNRVNSRVQQLESEVKTLRDQQSKRPWPKNEGLAAFVSGAFCALWAQNTRRNAWLWFFVGLIFNVFALMVLLYKNSQDRT